jgi:hypothetical protein
MAGERHGMCELAVSGFVVPKNVHVFFLRRNLDVNLHTASYCRSDREACPEVVL